MKSAPFGYVRPATVEDACAELAADDDSAVLSGGQSLVPVLAMRLARPSVLVDINAVSGLDELEVADGWLSVGATVRQRRVEREPAAGGAPLLRQALPWVGHRELRSRGTVCGSLAHADPAAELPAVACCLGARMELTGSAGTRILGAREFFTGAMSTALRHDELLTRVSFPVASAGDGYAFGEVARRHGDFALAGVATHVRLADGDARAVVTSFGVADRPVTREVDAGLLEVLCERGAFVSTAELLRLLGERADALAADLVETAGDAHAGPGYRRRLVRGLLARGLVTGYRAAREGEAADGS